MTKNNFKGTKDIVGERLVGILQGIRHVREAYPLLDDETFIGASFAITPDHYGGQLGYSPLGLDKLVIRADIWQMQEMISRMVVPSLDKKIRQEFPEAVYSGERHRRAYKYPFSWILPVVIVGRK